jgi:hypothetical protein
MAHLPRRLNPPKNNTSASAVPPGETQNRNLLRFSALDAPMVMMVSVEVWAAVPLRVTETGLRVHSGTKMPPGIVVVTLHVRFTVPLNPLVPTTLIVPVFPVVEPRVTVMDAVEPGPAVKPGGGRIE